MNQETMISDILKRIRLSNSIAVTKQLKEEVARYQEEVAHFLASQPTVEELQADWRMLGCYHEIDGEVKLVPMQEADYILYENIFNPKNRMVIYQVPNASQSKTFIKSKKHIF